MAQRLFEGTPGVSELIAMVKDAKAQAASPKKDAGSSAPQQAQAAPARQAAEPAVSSAVPTNYTKEQEAWAQRVVKSGTYFDMLDLASSCSQIDVRKAFRKQALKLHPDKNKAPSAEAAFKLVNEALQTLTDPVKRDAYMYKLRRPAQPQRRAPQPTSYKWQNQKQASSKAKPTGQQTFTTAAGQGHNMPQPQIPTQCQMCKGLFLKPAVQHRYAWCPHCSFISMVSCPTRPGACTQPCQYCLQRGIAANVNAPSCGAQGGVAPAYAKKQGQCLRCAHPCAVTLTNVDMAGIPIQAQNLHQYYAAQAQWQQAAQQQAQQQQQQQTQGQKRAAPYVKKQAAKAKAPANKKKKRKKGESSDEEMDFSDTTESEAEFSGEDDEEDEDERIKKLIDDGDICLNCMESGFLILCEECGKGFHLECLYPPMSQDEVPEDEWYCESCIKASDGKLSNTAVITGKKCAEKAVQEEDEEEPLDSKSPFSIGDLVWGKFPNYPWWPGMIVELSSVEDFDTRKELNASRKKSKGSGHVVKFFGDEDHSWMPLNLIHEFASKLNANCAPNKGNTKAFKKGVAEAKAIAEAKKTAASGNVGSVGEFNGTNSEPSVQNKVGEDTSSTPATTSSRPEVIVVD